MNTALTRALALMLTIGYCPAGLALVPAPFAPLIGGLKEKLPQIQQVVVRVSETTQSGCTAMIVGTTPLTAITSAHCFDTSRPLGAITLGGHPIQGIIIGNASKLDEDVAVLVLPMNAKIEGVDKSNTFLVPKSTASIKNKTMSMRVCGFGAQEGILKCGRNVYQQGISHRGQIHVLYGRKVLECAQAGEPLSETFASGEEGDSGGPLFYESKGRLIAVGALHGGVKAKNAHALPNMYAVVKDCELAPDDLAYNIYTSLSIENQKIRGFLDQAVKKIGADISYGD